MIPSCNCQHKHSTRKVINKIGDVQFLVNL